MSAIKRSGIAAFAATAVVLLAGCGSGHKTSITVPLRARETSIVGAYDLLHRLGLRVTLTHAAGLKDVHHKGLVVAPFGHLVRGGLDGDGLRRRQMAGSTVDLGGGRLDEPEGPQERPLKAHPADGEILHGPGGLRSIERVPRHAHLAHAVALDPVVRLHVPKTQSLSLTLPPQLPLLTGVRPSSLDLFSREKY